MQQRSMNTLSTVYDLYTHSRGPCIINGCKKVGAGERFDGRPARAAGLALYCTLETPQQTARWEF